MRLIEIGTGDSLVSKDYFVEFFQSKFFIVFDLIDMRLVKSKSDNLKYGAELVEG